MATLLLSPEDQLQRLNALVAEVETWQSLNRDQLLQQPAPGKWSIIEIVGHMNAAYGIYRDRIGAALTKLPSGQRLDNTFRARWFPKLFIKMMRPQNGQRKWKMKTLPKFEPETAQKAPGRIATEAVFEDFFGHQDHLRKAILDSRGRDIRGVKVVSSIGPILRFYLPECFDFIISHEERHLVQAKEIMENIEAGTNR